MNKNKLSRLSISFVIPVYRSEKTICKVVDDINLIKNIDWEVILVNDDSPDLVDGAIKKLIISYPKKITYIKLHKNCGQHAAIIRGLSYVTKKYVATIDDDGQNSPSEILKLIDKMNDENLDVVYGQIKDRKQLYLRKVISKVNIVITKYTIGNHNNIPISNVRLFKKDIAKNIAMCSHRYNYIEGLIFSMTNKISFVPINQNVRIDGKSTYNFITLLKVLINHVVGYSNILLRFLTFISLLVSAFAFLVGLIYFLITIGSSNRPVGWLSTYLTITFLFSLLFLILSILTEYIGRIYSKINQPIQVASDVIQP